MLLLTVCKMPNQRKGIRWGTNLHALWLDAPTSELNGSKYQRGFCFSNALKYRQVFNAKTHPIFVYDPD